MKKWRAISAGSVIGTAVSVAIGIHVWWPSLLLAGVALAIDAMPTLCERVLGVRKEG